MDLGLAINFYRGLERKPRDRPFPPYPSARYTALTYSPPYATDRDPAGLDDTGH